MANEQKDEIVEQDATITFDIPAYKDKNTQQPFKRIVKCKTKKAYAIYKKTIQSYTPPEQS